MLQIFTSLRHYKSTPTTAALTLSAALLVLPAPDRVSAADIAACNSNLQTLSAYENYEPCPAGFSLHIDDRFDRFDDAIWERSTGGFPDNECRFIDAPDRVRYDSDGIMRLVMEERDVPASYSRHELKMVGPKPCASGELRTLQEHGPYGRFEARMKSPESSGYIQSLFTFQFYKDPWQEIDIELQGRLPDQISTNVISNHAQDFDECDRYKCTHNVEQHDGIGDNHHDGWHVYTIDWLPDSIHFYVDGQLKRKAVATSRINQPPF